MADISISLKNVQNTKTVEIKGLGVLTIRKVGSGEDLDLSFKQRRTNRLIDDLTSIQDKLSGLDVTKDSDIKKIEKLLIQSEAISNELVDIKRSQFEIYKGLLSDDKGGELVDTIMNTLSDTERAEIFNIAFNDEKVIEKPDKLDAPEVADE